MPKTIVRGYIRKTKKGRVKVKPYKRRQYKALIRNYGVLTSRKQAIKNIHSYIKKEGLNKKKTINIQPSWAGILPPLEKLHFTEKELAERELRGIKEEERKNIEKHIIKKYEEGKREKAKREWDELTKNK